MSNPNRKMATIRCVTGVSSIENADRIETVHVGGWTVVDQKGKWQEGDLCVYFEPDTALPISDERYAFLGDISQTTMIINGAAAPVHVLRTRRFRGVYSQGLLMRPQDVLPSSIPERAYEDMYERKTNLTSLCGVCEYDPIRTTDQGNMHILRKYDQWAAPRTNAERIQNVSEDVFALVKKTDYLVSVKVDGTSVTMLDDPRYQKVRVFSHNNELSVDGGFGEQVYRQADEQGIVKWLNDHPGITLQMEACGPKINGNRLGLKAMRLYIFSAWDTVACKYLDPYRIDDCALDPACTPELSIDLDDFATTIDLIDYVDGLRGHVNSSKLDEGIVIHVLGNGICTIEEMRKIDGELGPQRQMKVISRKYLLKAKE